MKKAILLPLLFTLAACTGVTSTVPPQNVTPLSASATSAVSITDTPTLTPIDTVEPTPTYGVGSTVTSDSDEAPLVYVPAGEFLMGSDEIHTPNNGEDSPSYYDNQPQRSIYLDAFWIDKIEVTNRQYALCVSDGACALPTNLKSITRSSYYGDPAFDDYPVVYIDWYMAEAYCGWAGRRLPTEAEWEKAARGGNGNTYPWGDEPPNDILLNFDSPVRDTKMVGSYPKGASPYGALDMAGNVWEWVNDWYNSSYYQFIPTSNPPGPEPTDRDTRDVKSLRGGSWYFLDGSFRSIFRYGVIPVNELVRADMRSWLAPDYSDTSKYGKPPHGVGTVGFRCAMTTTP